MADVPPLDADIRLLQQSITALLQLHDLDDTESSELNELNMITHILAQLNSSPSNMLLPPLHEPPPPPPHTPPPRMHVDRWHTPVSVERIVRGRMRNVKWFSDFQMAYLYVQGIVNDDTNEDHIWNIADFYETADRMDEYWNDGEEGLAIARCDAAHIVYIAYYEPTDTGFIPASRVQTQSVPIRVQPTQQRHHRQP